MSVPPTSDPSPDLRPLRLLPDLPADGGPQSADAPPTTWYGFSPEQLEAIAAYLRTRGVS